MNTPETKINDGGPAFPLPLGNESIDPSCAGLSVRDYFAAKALVAVINDTWRQDQPDEPYSDLAPSIASDAYIIADAMLKARE